MFSGNSKAMFSRGFYIKIEKAGLFAAMGSPGEIRLL